MKKPFYRNEKLHRSRPGRSSQGGTTYPIRTLESWESEVRTPPEYVLQLLEESVRRTDMVEVTFM